MHRDVICKNWDEIKWDEVDPDQDFLNWDDITKVSHNISLTDDNTDFTPFNRSKLLEYYSKIKDCKSILEIGVSRNLFNKSSTSIFLNNKNDNTIYIGVDIEDKKFIDNSQKNVFSFQCNSEKIEAVMWFARSKGVDKFDFIFLDGWHSINQLKKEMEYSNYLSADGIIGFHDVNYHPGPIYTLMNLDKKLWDISVYKGDTQRDWGIAFAQKKLQV